jgi:transposase-like protein
VGLFDSGRVTSSKSVPKQFSAKFGTIFEDSPLKLETWLAGIWITVNAKNSVSSHEVARSLGITQKSAWFMLGRIRHALDTGSFMKMVGTVEADETAIGGLEKNKHESKKLRVGGGTGGKQIVLGMLERKSGEVRMERVPNTTHGTLQPIIRRNVGELSSVYTDSADGYLGLSEWYMHEAVNHSAEEYVRGQVHTNSIEGCWNLFKRCYKGTWTHLSEEHLHRYLTDQEFRYNNCRTNDGSRFAMAVAMTVDKRLTWDELVTDGLVTMLPRMD